MKKTGPLVLGFLFGAFALAEFYIPHHAVAHLSDEFRAWASILGAIAFILGGINILQVNVPKVRRREEDWPYKVVLLASAAIMLLAGLPWHRLGGAPATAPQVTTEEHGGPAEIVVVAPAGVTIQIGGVLAPGDRGDAPFVQQVEPGPVEVKLSRRLAGYEPQAATVDAAPGRRVTVTGDPGLLWGRSGRVFVWIYEHVFSPANSTMFALLAFFVASAAFRAFRARNAEAALLLGAAILMMLGRAPLGRAISDVFPDLAQWILDVPSNGGRRAIMMGAAIGAISTGLRVIVGLERSHLGGDK